MFGAVGCAELRYDANMTLRALIHSAEKGGYWAEVPALPGCVSQGETVDDLCINIREAIEGWVLAARAPLRRGRRVTPSVQDNS